MTGSSGDFILMASGEKILDKFQSKYDEATYQSLVFIAYREKATYDPKDLKAF
jgi:hypothetical protein